jgi:hypothetical protein
MTPPHRRVVQVEDQTAPALAAHRGDDPRDVVGVERQKFASNGQLRDVPLFRGVPFAPRPTVSASAATSNRTSSSPATALASAALNAAVRLRAVPGTERSRAPEQRGLRWRRDRLDDAKGRRRSARSESRTASTNRTASATAAAAAAASCEPSPTAARRDDRARAGPRPDAPGSPPSRTKAPLAPSARNPPRTQRSATPCRTALATNAGTSGSSVAFPSTASVNGDERTRAKLRARQPIRIAAARRRKLVFLERVPREGRERAARLGRLRGRAASLAKIGRRTRQPRQRRVDLFAHRPLLRWCERPLFEAVRRPPLGILVGLERQNEIRVDTEVCDDVVTRGATHARVRAPA